MYMGMNAAFGNALQLLQTGKSTFTRAGMKEGLDPQSLANRKQNTTEQMKQAAQQLNTPGQMSSTTPSRQQRSRPWR